MAIGMHMDHTAVNNPYKWNMACRDPDLCLSALSGYLMQIAVLGHKKSSVAVSEAGVSRMCSGRGSFHRKIQVKSSQVSAGPVAGGWDFCHVVGAELFL
jgi:hypothetical protein